MMVTKPDSEMSHTVAVLPELVFTKRILQILYWISEIVIHSRVFVLDLHVNIETID
jgi:hypothetical protein